MYKFVRKRFRKGERGCNVLWFFCISFPYRLHSRWTERQRSKNLYQKLIITKFHTNKGVMLKKLGSWTHVYKILYFLSVCCYLWYAYLDPILKFSFHFPSILAHKSWWHWWRHGQGSHYVRIWFWQFIIMSPLFRRGDMLFSLFF